ncbi:hypothetical protein TREMEDRAFT_44744 [Tremella mesenterica DSM 1558]|uniref:uncharacterized protein n=1 Tax=Tremella mesenterica (strain ATCC 24925 / CBS 8224 / DSM 1558 / NBRC 9311 / NRRL Y-6157 / RJB 2259-6 / UBC 559-6) TaxID=578456 RepID=UPI0003F4A2C7|nr:uncharacterized protein TREMEDRAFT_44744 [Tremella mesenterica DSM 1558]EIW68364.1 hypothetical protein TREMEDRAFT_44744 [Tremella mesenterica DSM 1558]
MSLLTLSCLSGPSLLPLTLLPKTTFRSYITTPYTPHAPPSSRRPPRPSSPAHFTGHPTLHTALSELRTTLQEAQTLLRQDHIYPLPTSLPYLQPPATSWIQRDELAVRFSCRIRTKSHNAVVELLNEMHHLRHVASVAGADQAAVKLAEALNVYERIKDREGVMNGEKDNEKNGVDEYGRSFGFGRRKESSARVWLIPTKTSRNVFNPINNDTGNGESNSIPIAQVLINHQPLSTYFSRISDRETILRPLRLAAVLGGYNIFALVRGGGTTGQAGAITLGLARALAVMREDSRRILFRDGALMRDTRMVERKKTGKAKARKAYTWVKR